jgi:hypothetical protein
VALRICTVAVKDVQDVEHSVEVTAETLYEAIATALAALQKDVWVGEIGQGFTTVTVVVQQPPGKARGQNKRLPFLAWTPRAFSRRGHPEAKAGENTWQSEPRADVTGKAKQTNQPEEISEVSLTWSSSWFLGVLRLLPRLRNTRFHR